MLALIFTPRWWKKAYACADFHTMMYFHPEAADWYWDCLAWNLPFFTKAASKSDHIAAIIAGDMIAQKVFIKGGSLAELEAANRWYEKALDAGYVGPFLIRWAGVLLRISDRIDEQRLADMAQDWYGAYEDAVRKRDGDFDYGAAAKWARSWAGADQAEKWESTTS